MRDSFKDKKRSVIILCLVVGLNSLAIFLAGIFNPPAIMLVGMIFGVYVYYLTYSIPARKAIWMELRLFLVALTGISIGSLALWVACGYIDRPVCLSNAFRAQIFGNYAFPMIFLLMTWLAFRLPRITRIK